MDFLGLIKGALGVIGDITGISILKDASRAIETIAPEKQAELQAALMKHQEAMMQLSIDEFKTSIAESLSMINSPDKFTSRARPAGVYAASLITMVMAGAMVFGVKLDTAAIATLMTPLWGSAAFYTYNRTREKMNGN